MRAAARASGGGGAVMTPETFLDGRVTLYCGDSRDALDLIEPNSVDNCACDPPYALVSIGKALRQGGAPRRPRAASISAPRGASWGRAGTPAKSPST